MKKKTRRETTTERREVWVITATSKLLTAFCGGCGSDVRMITTEEAAAMARTSTRTIYRWVEAGEVHFSETSDGNLIVCANSLATGDEIHRR